MLGLLFGIGNKCNSNNNHTHNKSYINLPLLWGHPPIRFVRSATPAATATTATTLVTICPALLLLQLRPLSVALTILCTYFVIATFDSFHAASKLALMVPPLPSPSPSPSPKTDPLHAACKNNVVSSAQLSRVAPLILKWAKKIYKI